MERSLPLTTLIETAKQMTEIEKKISEIYKSVNLSLEQAIKNAQELERLKENTIEQMVLIYEEIENAKISKDS
jgi:methyl-accepting chemotaxis protein